MLDKYLYLGTSKYGIDNYVTFLRRSGFSAYIKTSGKDVYLLADKQLFSVNFLRIWGVS